MLSRTYATIPVLIIFTIPKASMSMMDDLRLMEDASLGSADVVSFDGLDLMLDEQFGHLGYDDSGISNVKATDLNANDVSVNEIHINGFNMNGVNVNGIHVNGINMNGANANHINASDFAPPGENSNVLDDMVVETFFPDMLMTQEEKQIDIQEVKDESKTNESYLVPICDDDYSINMEDMDMNMNMNMEEAIMNDTCLDNIVSLEDLGPAHPDFIFPEQEEKQDGEQQQVKQVLQQQQQKLNVQQNHQKQSVQQNQQKKIVRQNRRKKNAQRCQQQKQQQQRQPKKPRRSSRARKIVPDPPSESAALPAPILSSSQAVRSPPVRAPTPTLSQSLPSNSTMPRAPIGNIPLAPIVCNEYCGLKPSNTDFYPFITLPPEVTMKRCQKLFPLLNKLNTTSIMTLTGDSTLTTAIISGPLPRPSGSMAALQMATARKVASQIKIKDLKKELMGVLRMLTRQRCFLEQSMRNMDAWCHSNLDAHDLATVYHDNSVAGAGASGAAMMRDYDKCGLRLQREHHVTATRVGSSHFWGPQPPSTGSNGTVVGVL